MTPAAQENLRTLRQRLADLEPYPWEPVEAWIASAKPLIKAHYGAHVGDFVVVTTTPMWCEMPLFASGGGRWGGPQRDNFAQAAATEEREDRKLSAAAKAKMLGFLDGLLDLPGVEPAAPATKATRTMSKNRSSILDHEEILKLRAAVISARLSGGRGGLVAGIPAEFVASLPDAKAAGEQVLTDLDALNTAGALANGSVPLVIWLSNAIALSGGRQEARVFEEALERCRGVQSESTVQGSGSASVQGSPARPSTIISHPYGDLVVPNSREITELIEYVRDHGRKIPSKHQDVPNWQNSLLGALGGCFDRGTDKVLPAYEALVPIAKRGAFWLALRTIFGLVGRYSPADDAKIIEALSELEAILADTRTRAADHETRARVIGQSHHHGDVHMGSTFTTTITGSTVGAIATGDGAVATGTVTVHQGALTQAQHLEHIKAAKKALADDEEHLEARIYEALEQFLKSARDVKVESRAIGQVQAEMEEILDRVWAQQSAKALPKGLKVVEALAKSPAMIEVTKKLVGA